MRSTHEKAAGNSIRALDVKGSSFDDFNEKRKRFRFESYRKWVFEKGKKVIVLELRRKVPGGSFFYNID